MDLQRHEERRMVRVPTPSGEDVLVDPTEHREDVVRRLLHLGVTPRCLATLLPEWDALISCVARSLAGEPSKH